MGTGINGQTFADSVTLSVYADSAKLMLYRAVMGKTSVNQWLLHSQPPLVMTFNSALILAITSYIYVAIVHYITVQPLLSGTDYPDMLKLTRYTNTHAQSAWVMTFWGCGNSWSRRLAVAKTYLADLCACMNAADRDHPIGVLFQG